MKRCGNGVLAIGRDLFKTGVVIFDQHGFDAIRVAERRYSAPVTTVEIAEQYLELLGSGQFLQSDCIRIVTQDCVRDCSQVLRMGAAVVFEFGIADVPRDQPQARALARTCAQERALSQRIEVNRGGDHQQAENSEWNLCPHGQLVMSLRSKITTAVSRMPKM